MFLSCRKRYVLTPPFLFLLRKRYVLTPVLSFCLAKRKEPFSDFQRKEKRLDSVLPHFRKPARRSGSIPRPSHSAAAALCEFEALFPVRSAPLGDTCKARSRTTQCRTRHRERHTLRRAVERRSVLRRYPKAAPAERDTHGISMASAGRVAQRLLHRPFGFQGPQPLAALW